jgi:phospholipid-transporting ATPase
MNADDFARLVSSANPASRQYQPANAGYPPSHSHGMSSPNQVLDPFFDDEDDGPSSAFGRSLPMQSKESNLPLRMAAADPAGHSKVTLPGSGQPQGWNFDDDIPIEQPSVPFQGSASFPGTKSESPPPRPKRVRKWKWPWVKDQEVLKGERVIHLNDFNGTQNPDFGNNYISTSKYNAATFVPKFLLEQFSKYANLFFLFTACIQQIPDVSPTNKYTTIAPLAVVLLASAFKETQEDLKRHQSDRELNSRLAKVMCADGSFESRKWKNIRVGDVIRVESNDSIPADLVLLSSSEPEGLCYIETSNLDGETNLKIKQANPLTSHLTAPPLVTALRGALRSEHPNNSLYTYEGTLDLVTEQGVPKQVPLGPDQILLRGAQLRNTPWVYGLVVFTGHETKLMRNATYVFGGRARNKLAYFIFQRCTNQEDSS